LFAALLFLVILSLLGTSGVTTNTLQEHMASNARNRDLAFQAAEHALEDAHGWMETQDKDSMRTLVDASGVDLVTGDGIRAGGETHANDAGYWQSANWTTDVISPGGTDLSQVVSQPLYVVERLPSYTDPNPGQPCSSTCDYYRVTARGLGGVDQVAVILQTLYRFEE